jgi:hypothetical protein
VVEVSLLMIVGLASATGEQLKHSPEPSSPVVQHRAEKNPYRELFRVPPVAGSIAKVEPSEIRDDFARTGRYQPPPAKNVCGVLVIPVDPSLDPGILIDPKTGKRKANQADYMTPTLKPEVCTKRASQRK